MENLLVLIQLYANILILSLQTYRQTTIFIT